eukprot:TRINITY_DN49_c0_g1_i1.p5 TRINITY_DN49_c0_g1~~TRINITY_DN49_c0_g1_i1.p5  ORF type:complete len:53 (+),score=33.60 TRINITY_DN49_c0_g1_i1:172-330(+)
MDAIHPDSAKMFAKSKYPMVQMIGAGTHHKKKKKKKYRLRGRSSETAKAHRG